MPYFQQQHQQRRCQDCQRWVGLVGRQPGFLAFIMTFLFLSTYFSSTGVLSQPADCLEPHRTLLMEYKAFHQANKHHPEAQYLVQKCWGNECMGTGDRIRGTMWLLRIAITHKKILLVDWTQPAALTNFLLPNEIDWTFSGFDPAIFRVNNNISSTDFYAAVYEGQPDALEKFRATKSYAFTTNEHFYVNIMAGVVPVDYDRKIDIGFCYYNFLFKFNSTITEMGDFHLRQLYGPSPGNFVAWHWRHFDADRVMNEPVMMSDLQATMACAKQLSNLAGIDLLQRPILLVTDFNVFRQMVMAGELTRVVTPNITARHISQGGHPLEIINGVFVDLYLLSRARCLLTSKSGFSKLALWMAGGELLKCHRDMLKCVEEVVWRH